MPNRIPVTIHEPAGVRRRDFPVTTGLPFPAGQLRSAAEVRLVDQRGRERPTHATPLFTWPDRSIKWLLIDSQVDIEPMESAQLGVEYGAGLTRSAAIGPLEVAEEADAIRVDTGALRLTIGRSGARLIRRVETTDPPWQAVVDDGISELRATDAAGRVYAGAIESAAVEEHNPLRAVVLVKGGYVAPDGERLMSWQVRLYAFAGQSFVRLYHTFVHDQPAPTIELRELAIVLPIELTGPRRAFLGAAGASRGRGSNFGSGYDVGELTERVRLVQPALGYHHLVRASGGRESARTYSFGWLHLFDDSNGATIKLRHPWQNYPTACATDGRALELLLYPDLSPEDRAEPGTGKNYVALRQGGGKGLATDGAPDYDGPLRVPRGMAKTHEVYLSFGRPCADPGEVDAACLAFEMPLLLQADSRWFADSGAFGRFGAYLPDHWHLEQRLREMAVMPNGRGIVNYGDVVVMDSVPRPDGAGETLVTRTVENLAYDLPRSILRAYVRNGHQPFFWEGEAAVMHLIDVDTVHFSSDHPEWEGGPHMEWAQNHHYATTDETDQAAPAPTHTWIGGMLDYYCLTGYRRALEVAHQAVEFCGRTTALGWEIPPEKRARALERDESWPYVTRVASWALLALGQLYELEREPALVPTMRRLADLFVAWQDEDGRWRQPIGTFNRGGVPFMIAGVLQALQQFVRNFADERVGRALDNGARFVATRLVTPEGLMLYVEAPIAWRAHSSDLMMLGPLTEVFERNGDVAVLETAYRHFRWMVDEKTISTYLLKDVFAALPTFERLGLLAPYRAVDLRARVREAADDSGRDP